MSLYKSISKYIKICSKCKNRQIPETVIREGKLYLKCRQCGHEKFIYTMKSIEFSTDNEKSILKEIKEY